MGNRAGGALDRMPIKYRALLETVIVPKDCVCTAAEIHECNSISRSLIYRLHSKSMQPMKMGGAHSHEYECYRGDFHHASNQTSSRDHWGFRRSREMVPHAGKEGKHQGTTVGPSVSVTVFKSSPRIGLEHAIFHTVH